MLLPGPWPGWAASHSLASYVLCLQVCLLFFASQGAVACPFFPCPSLVGNGAAALIAVVDAAPLHRLHLRNCGGAKSCTLGASSLVSGAEEPGGDNARSGCGTEL
ncbi:hypothetical protein B0I37DRAFT_380053 [Chaetomium sp. MPI-CAGE-AT-0009]|nr:hypothetical protein B0I37DRAFT_380053 [Chaetomium sp. MPI-CAGE-AT-0009]